MRNKVLNIAKNLSERIKRWEGVECVTLGEAAEIEIYDPYFIIDLDVLYRGSILPTNDRRKNFGEISGFESSPVYQVDNFLIEDLPVRVNYQETTRIELILERIENGKWSYREGSTNIFYRIQHGEVIYSRGDWLERIKKRVEAIPEDFWRVIMESARCQLSRILSDLGASAYRKDTLFFTISAADFLKVFLSFIFADNRTFEPSGRMLLQRVMSLPRLPDGFEGRLESFLRYDGTFDLEKKREIAELLFRSILS